MSDYNSYNQNQNPNGAPSPNQQNTQPPVYSPPQYQPQQGMEPPPGYPQRSRKVAGLLAILLGTFGVHSFYLGNSSRGLMQLLISILTCGIGAIVIFIWSLMDGVKLLDGRINVDAYGVYLKD